MNKQEIKNTQNEIVKKPFLYRRKDKEPVALKKLSIEELQEEIAILRKRKDSIAFCEKKLEKELMNRLKNEPAPRTVIAVTNKSIV